MCRLVDVKARSALLFSSNLRKLRNPPSPLAAQRIITGIEKNQPRILIGNDARFMDLLQRFRPATYWAVLAKRIGRVAEEKGK
ncbi:hypothetical protein V1288_001143 [Bradyrhizobium sp. AZCC 2176]